MSNPIASTGSAPDSTFGAPHKNASSPVVPADSPSVDGDSAPDPADLQLVIEGDAKAGCFVYKTVDRRTGEVVSQYPRDQILKMREADSYTAGTVIKASV
jgi:flagellar protein FlaG